MPIPPPESGAVALVTGASSGVGVELAKGFAARGYDLALVARRKARLDTLAAKLEATHGITAHALACDVADPGSRDALIERVEELGLNVDVLASNAGIGSSGIFSELDTDREVKLVRTNIEAPIAFAGAWLPGMVERKRGAVLFTSSLLAVHPLPRAATYGATKAALLWFADALRCEVAPHGITVTTVCPGPIRTEFFAASGVDAETAAPGFLYADAEQVAARAIDGLERGRRSVFPKGAIAAAAMIGRYLPRTISEPAVQRLFPV